MEPMEPVIVNGWQVDVWADAVKGEWLEDRQQIDEMYYLRAWNEGGTRYAHHHVFKNDRAAALKLLARVVASPDFSPENKPGVWDEIQPVYGSPAYECSGGDSRWHPNEYAPRGLLPLSPPMGYGPYEEGY